MSKILSRYFTVDKKRYFVKMERVKDKILIDVILNGKEIYREVTEYKSFNTVKQQNEKVEYLIKNGKLDK